MFFRDEARAFPGVARQARRETKGCMRTYSPRTEREQRRYDGKNKLQWSGEEKCGLFIVCQGLSLDLSSKLFENCAGEYHRKIKCFNTPSLL